MDKEDARFQTLERYASIVWKMGRYLSRKCLNKEKRQWNTDKSRRNSEKFS